MEYDVWLVSSCSCPCSCSIWDCMESICSCTARTSPTVVALDRMVRYCWRLACSAVMRACRSTYWPVTLVALVVTSDVLPERLRPASARWRSSAPAPGVSRCPKGAAARRARLRLRVGHEAAVGAGQCGQLRDRPAQLAVPDRQRQRTGLLDLGGLVRPKATLLGAFRRRGGRRSGRGARCRTRCPRRHAATGAAAFASGDARPRGGGGRGLRRAGGVNERGRGPSSGSGAPARASGHRPCRPARPGRRRRRPPRACGAGGPVPPGGAPGPGSARPVASSSSAAGVRRPRPRRRRAAPPPGRGCRRGR